LKYRSLHRRQWELAADLLFQEKKVPTGVKKIPIDVQTRWNSTWECIKGCIDNELVV
jgi:hypothetical protein